MGGFRFRISRNLPRYLENIYNFHLLAIDDTLDENHVLRVDNWDMYLFIVLRSERNKSQDSFQNSRVS